MINYQATRNLLRHPDLHSWVPGWATRKKFLNHRLSKMYLCTKKQVLSTIKKYVNIV